MRTATIGRTGGATAGLMALLWVLSFPASACSEPVFTPADDDRSIAAMPTEPVTTLGAPADDDRSIATTPTGPVTTLGAVTIIAPRTAADDDRSIAATLIEIDDDVSRSKTVADVLKTAAGVDVKSYGGLDGFSVAMIRGSSPGQVAVYLDGVPLNGATFGQVNLAEIPIAQIERIEIYRGFTPPRFARAGMGGVINLVTRTDAGATLGGGGRYGSFGDYRVGGNASADSGGAHFSIRGDTAGSRGDYTFPSDNGTPFTTADDFTDTRRNNRRATLSALANISGAVGRVRLKLNHNRTELSQGIAGLAANQSQSAWYGMTRSLTSIEGAASGAFAAPSLRLIYLTEEQEYHDSFGEVGVGNQENFSTLRRFGLEAGLSVAKLPFITGRGVFFASFYDETFSEEQRLQRNSLTPERRRRSYTLSGAAEIGVGESFALHPSLRFERYDNFFAGDPFFGFGDQQVDGVDSFLSPKLGLTWSLTKKVTLKANIGRFYRAPDMAELFGDRGIATGNSQLKPEKGVNADIGLVYAGELASGALGAEAFLFASRTDDLIAWVRNSQSTSIARNIGRADIVGLEMSFGWRMDALSLSGSATAQNAIDKSDAPHFYGNRLPDRPAFDLAAQAAWSAGHWRAFYDLSHTTELWLDRANFNSVAARTIHSAGVMVSDARYGELTFEIKNLTDDQVSDAIGYPLPGRSYYATYRWRIH